ncbi:MAG TPA: hypothetical protein VIC28_18265 [Thermoanaerobaculia bacterium]|jgi:hypothetical protein
MKRIVLFALLFAVTAAVAQARVEPIWGAPYACYYSNYTGNATNGGTSVWVDTGRFYPGDGTQLLIRCRESFDTSYGGDTYKCAWAKPVDGYNPYSGSFTTWEYTFTYGPQCKNTVVKYWGTQISFSNCTDGHSRICYLQ